MEEVERQTGQKPIGLQGPDFPEPMVGVWSAFFSLNSARGQGLNGPLPLTFTEIDAWLRLTRTPLRPWEVMAIKRLDKIFLEVIND